MGFASSSVKILPHPRGLQRDCPARRGGDLTGGGVGLEDAVVGRGRLMQIALSPSFLQGLRKRV